MTVVFESAVHTSIEVSDEMFGGNMLFLHNLLSEGTASFPDALSLLTVSGLRFPGGTITEVNFDIENPDGPPLNRADEQQYVGITEFLNFADATGQSPTIVLPTAKIYQGSPDGQSDNARSIDGAYMEKVLNFARSLLTKADDGPGSYPDVPISAFEIGNEYWGSGNMTSAEYGKLVNELVPRLVAIFDELLGPDQARPKILIQMGSPWGTQYDEGIYSNLTWAQKLEACNLDIIEQLVDPDAVSGIDGLIEHYYYTDPSNILGQNSASNSYIDIDFSIWERSGFAGLDLSLTEWGVFMNNSAQFGLKGAGVVVEQMEHMVKMGVDSAFAWPVQGWNTSLAGLPNTSPELSPMGAAFKAMSESIRGAELLGNGISTENLEVNTFASNGKVVLFVMSRSESVQLVELDVSELVGEYTRIEGLKIGVGEGVSIDDPRASAVLSYYGQDDLLNLGNLDFTLNPYELIRIEYFLPLGRKYFGTISDDRHQAGDGDDSLFGNRGDDSLIGGKGADSIEGSAGRDFLNGWGGSDTIQGGSAADFLYGQGGNDSVLGGRGGDCIAGDDGFDVLLGGVGADSISGGFGDDILSGGKGMDTLVGGEGADTFVFSLRGLSQRNGDCIADFEVGVDHISLPHAVLFGLSRDEFLQGAFHANMSGLATDLNDRVVYERDRGVLWLDLDGSETEYERFKVARLDEFLNLTENDFIFP